MHILDKIISNFKNNKSLYIGEKITMAEHMIQSAMLAEKAKSNNDIRFRTQVRALRSATNTVQDRRTTNNFEAEEPALSIN